MLTWIFAAFFAAVGVFAIWATRKAAEASQKLNDVLDVQTSNNATKEAEREILEAAASARTRAGSYDDDRVSATPLPEKYLRD